MFLSCIWVVNIHPVPMHSYPSLYTWILLYLNDVHTLITFLLTLQCVAVVVALGARAQGRVAVGCVRVTPGIHPAAASQVPAVILLCAGSRMRVRVSCTHRSLYERAFLFDSPSACCCWSWCTFIHCFHSPWMFCLVVFSTTAAPSLYSRKRFFSDIVNRFFKSLKWYFLPCILSLIWWGIVSWVWVMIKFGSILILP